MRKTSMVVFVLLLMATLISCTTEDVPDVNNEVERVNEVE